MTAPAALFVLSYLVLVGIVAAEAIVLASIVETLRRGAPATNGTRR